MNVNRSGDDKHGRNKPTVTEKLNKPGLKTTPKKPGGKTH